MKKMVINSLRNLLKKLFTPLPFEVYPKIVSLIALVFALPVSLQLLYPSTRPNPQAAFLLDRIFSSDLSPIYLIIGAFILANTVCFYFLKLFFRRF